MISHKHKCIFIHIPKTAGTSINSFFHPNVKFHYNNPDYNRLFGWCPKRNLHMQHATARQLIETELVTEEQWKTYFKFAFIRNPWDRAYSDYNWVKSFAQVTGSFKEYINKTGSFNSIFNYATSAKYLGDHLLPQSNFFDIKGEYELDFVGRFESFNTDIKKVLTILDINDSFNHYKNKSNRIKDYSHFYTESNKKLVEQAYQIDIEKFNYKFEDNRKGLNWIKKFI